MSNSWWRKRPRGRFIHPCLGGCGGYLKARKTHCYGCMLDLLSDLPAGTWRENTLNELKRKREEAAFLSIAMNI